MKKSLSMLLAVIMLLSVISTAIVPAGATELTDTLFSVSKSDFLNDRITYTVNLKSGITKLTGAIFHIEYASSDLSVVSCGAAGTYSGSTFIPNVSGEYVSGPKAGTSNIYSVGFINAGGITLGADTAFIEITFEAVSADRPVTDVSFNCIELITEDSNDDNNIEKADGAQIFYADSFHTLSRPVITAVDSYGEDSLKVQWNACTGADSYTVYRLDGTSWVSVATGLTATEYVDSTITQGVKYTYLVTATNEAGETAKVGNGVSGKNFGTIKTIDAEPIENGIKVWWSTLDGATYYEVSRKLATEDASAFTVVGKNITSASYNDTTALSGKDYHYSVRAFDGDGYTATMTADYAQARYIAKPPVSVANIREGIQVTISEVGGATSYTLTKAVTGGATTSFEITASSFTDGKYTYIDKDVTDNGQYTYSAQATDGTLNSAITKCNVFTRLATPVLGSVENTDSGIKFSWNAVSGATQYTVYRKTGTGAFTKLGDSTSATSIVDSSAANGTLYTYTVAAENSTGCSAYNTTGKSIKRITTPTAVSATTVSNGISIKWNAVSGATKYTVYRKTSTGSYTQVGTPTTTSFVDTTAAKNVQYTYSVAAVIDSYSSAINATGAQGMNFGTVTSLKYTAIEKGVTLTWNKLDNAKGYKVYRKTASDSTYANIATVTSGVSYNDTSISSGVVYYYKVEAYNGSNVAEMTASVLQVKYLSAPSFTARNSGDNVKITITPVYGATSYVIERAVGTSTTFSALTTLKDGTLEYIDSKDIVAGQKYTYRIKAVADSVQSFYTTVSMTKMIAPTIYSYYNEVAGIQIKWTAVEDATSYKVYRKLPSQSEWTLITTTGKSKTDFLDASVIGNTAYQYTVEAITPDGATGYNDGIENRFIETPDLTSRANAVGGVQITWKQVAGATSYRIYRRGAGTNYWYYLGSVSASESSFFDKEGTDKSQIKSGNYYRYTVRAVYSGTDSKGAKHERYSGFDTNGLYLKYVATPKLTSISNAGYGNNEGLKITWNKVNGGGTTWYRVYRRGAGSYAWRYLGATQGNSWLDTETKNYSGNYYRYTVRAVAGTQDKGWYSAFDTNGLYLKRVANPTLISATKSDAGITVKWGAVKGTTGYYVYRKTAGTTWKQVGVVKGTNNVTFLDKSAVKGTTYTYTVRACYGYTRSSYNPTGISCKR